MLLMPGKRKCKLDKWDRAAITAGSQQDTGRISLRIAIPAIGKVAKYKIESKLWLLQERRVEKMKIQKDGYWTQFAQ